MFTSSTEWSYPTFCGLSEQPWGSCRAPPYSWSKSWSCKRSKAWVQ